MENFLKSIGIFVNVPEDSSPILKLFIKILVLGIVSLFYIFNIIVYLLIIYFSNNEKVLSIVSKHKYLLKIFNFYRKTQIIYLILEFALLIGNVGLITWFSYCFVTGVAFL